MNEEWAIDIGFVAQDDYYEIHLRDEANEPIKFVTANSEAEVLERVRELLPRLRETETTAPPRTQEEE